MFFYRDVEKLRYRTEVYNIWAWVSGAFSIGAAYKYIENTWSGYLFISIGLLLLAVSLIASAKKIKRKIIKIETEDRKDEIKQEDDEKAIVKIKEAVAKIGIKITIKPEIVVQNLVASSAIGVNLNLNTLAMKLSNTEYEPEQFPGLVYKLMDAKATFLLFGNGKVVCTGTKSEAEVKAALEKLIVNIKKVNN